MSLCISSHFRWQQWFPCGEKFNLQDNQAHKPEWPYCCQKNSNPPLSDIIWLGSAIRVVWLDQPLDIQIQEVCDEELKEAINMSRCKKTKSTEDVRRKDEMFFFLRKEKHESLIQKTKKWRELRETPDRRISYQDQSGHKTYFHILDWNTVLIWKHTRSGQCNECILLLLHWVHTGGFRRKVSYWLCSSQIFLTIRMWILTP